MATRAVAIPRRRRAVVLVRPRSRARTKFTLPLAVIGGFTAQALPVLEAAMRGDMNGVLDKFLYQFGCYNKTAGAFEFGRIWQYKPLLAGIVIHKLANALGLNRALGRAHLPILRI